MNQTNIKILVVEDEFIIAEGIVQTLTNLGYTVLEIAMSYGQALEILDSQKPDLVLLDIQLNGSKDGIDLAWKIRENYNIPFIFLTANADAATVERAKQTDPPAYLVKPFNKSDLYVAIEICLHNFSKKQDLKNENSALYAITNALFIKDNYTFHKVLFQDILYLESDHVYINIYTLTKKIIVRATMQQYLENFPSQDFFRVHRSYVVNINHIDSVSTMEVLVKKNKIPIGKTYREELLRHLKLG